MYDAYHTCILFFERYVRILTYSILGYAYPRALVLTRWRWGGVWHTPEAFYFKFFAENMEPVLIFFSTFVNMKDGHFAKISGSLNEHLFYFVAYLKEIAFFRRKKIIHVDFMSHDLQCECALNTSILCWHWEGWRQWWLKHFMLY